MRVGFAGLGLMGAPMAANLLAAGVCLTVWNRSAGPLAGMEALGASLAGDLDGLFADSDVVILMLADDAAVDEVLDRDGPAFAQRVAGRLLVNMGTHPPAWSLALSGDVARAGGDFVEAPVSGSRGPAHAGRLFAMLAGAPEAMARAEPVLRPMCGRTVRLGAVPSALRMKLAVNLYLVASVAALAEAANLAGAMDLDLDVLGDVVGSGPLGSDVARAKLGKMTQSDFSPEAGIGDVVKNARLIARAASEAGADAPLLAESLSRFEAVAAAGGSDLDMAAVLTTYRPCGVVAA